jgi:S1-C subfamily serine protease
MNRKLHILAALVLLFSLASNVGAGTKSEEAHRALIMRVKRAVVILTTYDERGYLISQGSGFFVAPDRIITNAHVINTAARAQIETFDGHTFHAQGAVAIDEKRDLALLQIDAQASTATTLLIEDTIPAQGEEVFVVSNPRGSSWKVSSGAALATWNFQELGTLIRITAAISRGSSGGPVVNSEGRVVGIATMCLKRSEELYFAIPGKSISTLRLGTLMTFPLQRTN